jgi:hypothetical protein
MAIPGCGHRRLDGHEQAENAGHKERAQALAPTARPERCPFTSGITVCLLQGIPVSADFGSFPSGCSAANWREKGVLCAKAIDVLCGTGSSTLYLTATTERRK